MIDVKKVRKISSLTPEEEREVSKALTDLKAEAEEAAKLINLTWTFKLGETFVETTTAETAILGCKHFIYCSGIWHVFCDNTLGGSKGYEFRMDKDSIYSILAAGYVVQHKWHMRDESYDRPGLDYEAYVPYTSHKFKVEAKIARCFRDFLEVTKKKAGRTDG